jgi:hypothetical protein
MGLAEVAAAGLTETCATGLDDVRATGAEPQPARAMATVNPAAAAAPSVGLMPMQRARTRFVTGNEDLSSG